MHLLDHNKDSKAPQTQKFCIYSVNKTIELHCTELLGPSIDRVSIQYVINWQAKSFNINALVLLFWNGAFVLGCYVGCVRDDPNMPANDTNTLSFVFYGASQPHASVWSHLLLYYRGSVPNKAVSDFFCLEFRCTDALTSQVGRKKST